jgi:protein-tyrosine-phosphatase
MVVRVWIPPQLRSVTDGNSSVPAKGDTVHEVLLDLKRQFPAFNAAQRLHWSFDDPSGATGTDEARLAVFRRVRDKIRARLKAWLADGRPAGAITMRKP